MPISRIDSTHSAVAQQRQNNPHLIMSPDMPGVRIHGTTAVAGASSPNVNASINVNDPNTLVGNPSSLERAYAAGVTINRPAMSGVDK